MAFKVKAIIRNKPLNIDLQELLAGGKNGA
jgi:hypothetical protein